MRPRLRRLAADFNRVIEGFQDHPYIQVESYEGDPADKYVFQMTVPSLSRPDGLADPQLCDHHRVEVILPLEYPKRPPFCRMLTPVFHPNVSPAKICIGDHWSAGQSLPHLIARIAEMLCFQSYNVKSPLSAEAAAWTEMNEDKLPLSAEDMFEGL